MSLIALISGRTILIYVITGDRGVLLWNFWKMPSGGQESAKTKTTCVKSGKKHFFIRI